jgi:hypothetical protein
VAHRLQEQQLHQGNQVAVVDVHRRRPVAAPAVASAVLCGAHTVSGSLLQMQPPTRQAIQ